MIANKDGVYQRLYIFICANYTIKHQACGCAYVCVITVELTMEFRLIIRHGEPLIRDGKSNIESNAGARWFTCMCASYPSFEKLCGSGNDEVSAYN